MVPDIRDIPNRSLDLARAKHIYGASHWFTADQVLDEIVPAVETMATINPKCILELGLGRGGTHLMFREIAENVISVDHNQSVILACALSLQEIEGNVDGSYFVRGGGLEWETYRRVEKILKELKYESVDVLFCDFHWHDPSLALKSYEMYQPLVREGGLIFIHMYHNNAKIRAFVDEIAKEKELRTFISKGGWKVGLACITN
jgi:predicted O-methyltransferase YrrM